MKSRFNKVKSRFVNKFSFDNNTTLGIGNVQPLFCKQIAGGSKISVDFGQLTRLSPLVVPSFARLKQRNDFVFVPMSMVMPSFDAFLSQSAILGIHKRYIPDSLPCITNQGLFYSLVSNKWLCQASRVSKADVYLKSDIIGFDLAVYGKTTENIVNFVTSAPHLPTITDLPYSFYDFVLSSDFGDILCNNMGTDRFVFKLTQAGRFFYTALRGLGYTCDPNDTTPVSILPLWAFAKAYYDIYYPKRTNPWHASNYYNQINSFYNGDFIKKVVGSLTFNFVSDVHVLKPLFADFGGFDFFATIDDNLATVATSTPINSASSASDNSTFNNGNDTNASSFIVGNHSENDTGVPILYSNGGEGITVSADQLTLVHRLWNFVQKSSVVGQSVKDWFAVHLGLSTNEDMFDQTILVQSVTNDVTINPVISTAQTAEGDKGDNLGALAGQGYAQKNGNISFEARTYGYFMCLTSLCPVSGCSAGTNPELYCNTLYEQQLPDFDGVGYEALNMTSFNESYTNNNKSDVHDVTSLRGGFGFVPRLSSWKTLHGVRSGNFALPQLNSSFLPYCVDVLPHHPIAAGVIWRFPWSDNSQFLSFNRMFYNTAPTGFNISWLNNIEIPLDDNFMSQSVFDFTYTSFLKPLSDSYSVESLGNDLISVKEQ